MKSNIVSKLAVVAAILFVVIGSIQNIRAEEKSNQISKILKDNFESSKIGDIPNGWTIPKGNFDSVWKIVEDKTSLSGAKVLAQTSDNWGMVFNLCVADNTSFKNVEVSADFKAIKGSNDQGGGLVWRYQSKNNYYIVRFNPLEDNLTLYKVVHGFRLALASKEGLKISKNKWHNISIRMKNNLIECFLDGQKYLVYADNKFDKAGKVGLWTKSDAQTNFDNFYAKELN